MKRILVIILLVLCSLCVSSFVVEASEDYSSSQSYGQVVYVCTGNYATKYHSRKNCSGLGNCRGRIVPVSLSEARSEGRTACKKCC